MPILDREWRRGDPSRTAPRILNGIADVLMGLSRAISAGIVRVQRDRPQSSSSNAITFLGSGVRGSSFIVIENILGHPLGKAVQQLKRESGKGRFVESVKLPLAWAELGLIDEYEFAVQPGLAGHGPTLFAVSKRIDLKLVSRLEFGSGAVAMRYEPRR
jgi:hypothetical protein